MKQVTKICIQLSCFLQHFSQRWTNCWVGKRMGNRGIQPGCQENRSRNKFRYRFWEGSFVEQSRWKVICGTWPRDMAGTLAGRNWGWKTSKQLSGQFLLSRGKRKPKEMPHVIIPEKSLMAKWEHLLGEELKRRV